MRTIHHPSVIPVYLTATFWLIAGLFFPMTAIWQDIVYVVLSIGVYLAAGHFFPGTTEMLPEEEKAPDSGDAEVNNLISEGRKQRDLILRERDQIRDPETRAYAQAIASLSDKIFAALEEDASRAGKSRKFLSYYLPTTASLVQRYRELESQQVQENNITRAMQSIRETLKTAEGAFHRQLDSLYEAETMDITADIQVMKQMMASEGLLEKEKSKQ